ncbi:MAG TPA: protein kinase [Thermoanaerobaculia bacterium]|jgi:class 3 adenylate cyclase|nr:protein kinase [Thermoanaerobaculia bacterium]
MVLAAGKRVGPYRIHSQIGVGGMGEVYRAWDAKLRRDVAIKVLPPSIAKDREYLARFEREALAVAALSHPNILSIFDFGTDGGIAYAVTELLEGETLRARLTAAPVPPAQALSYAVQIARAMAAAHKKGVVHRDLKPDNVFVLADGHIKILDFGLAKRSGVFGEDSAAIPMSDLTEPGTVMGTAGYMSPEQVRGYSVDHRSDIFAFGTILYELLSGRRAFKKETPADTMAAILNEVPAELSASGRNISPDLDRIVRRCIEKVPQERFQSAQEVVVALEQAPSIVADGAGLSAVPKTGTLASSASAKGLTPTPSSRRGAPEAERRQVTVLVCGCEVFESEAYLERLDAEDQARVLRGFREACDRAARRFDGTVVGCDEHGLLLCFGYPVAYEDGARRAAHTAVAILAEMESFAGRLRGTDGLDLGPWVGVHTGPAVVGGGPGGVSLAGEARNVAVRLKEAAAAGQIICSGATHRLIRSRFDCASLGERRIRGLANPIEIFQVQGVGAVRSPIEAGGAAGLTPLTGRDLEITLLKDRWERAQEGAGQIVLLIGEAGLGKSRLVHTMKQLVRERADTGSSSDPSISLSAQASSDPPIVEWRCSRRLQNTGLYPATEFFERFLGIALDEAPSRRFERLVRHLRDYDLAGNDLVPLFASLLSLSPDERFPPLGLPPVREREETFRALVEWLRAYSGRRPVLFVVEDLHWADASTLEFLHQFFAEGLHERILTVATFRPEFQPPWPTAAHQTALALTSLTQRQVADLMGKKTGSVVPERLAEQVYGRTGGVPLFVEEYTRTLQESGTFDSAPGGGASLPAALPREIPSTLQDLIMARLDRMEGDREIAQIAAALGREFSYELLHAVAAVDESFLQDELGKLVQADILYPKGRAPRCRYVFKHALLEEALYNSLVKEKRQEYHRRIAEALEAGDIQAVETPPELIAHHLTEAGLTERAIRYWLKAGLRSRERSAEVEAIGHLSRGLELLATLPESPERDVEELALLSPLGTAFIASRGYAAPEVGPVFRRARELGERAGPPEPLFALMLGIWEWHTVRGDLRLCVDLAAEGMEFAARLKDPGMLMEALFMSGETRLYRADFAGARDCFATALAEYDDRERTRLWAARTSHNAGVTHRSNLAVTLWHLGFPDQSREVNLEMRRLAREIGHPYSLAYALHHTCWLYQNCRFGSEVRAAAEEEIEIALEQGFALWHATGTFFKGAGMLLEGEPAAGLPFLREGHDAFRAGGARLTVPFQLSTLGEALTRTRQFEQARRALDEGLAVGGETDERCQEAELYRLKGELLRAEAPEQVREAEDCFRLAIETARSQASKGWELKAATSLARLWQVQDRRAEARAVLESAYDSYSEGFTTPDLMDAAALLDALG